MEWNDLERLLVSTDPTAADTLADALPRLDERRRRALSAPLTKHVKAWWTDMGEARHLYPGSEISESERLRLENVFASVESMRLAVVGVTTGAAAVATWLRREAELFNSAWHNFPRGDELIDGGRRTDRLNRVLHARDDAWIADVFESLAAKLRYSGKSEWRDFVVAKTAELGITPPATVGFTECWIGRYINHSGLDYGERLERLRADPLLHRMLDALFTLDGLGRHFEILLWTDYSKRALPTYLASLLDHGDIDRRFLIDGCLRRLLRGGKPGDVRPYRKLLEDLAPTPVEVATQARDFAALLPDAPSTIAGTAQNALRAADEAGLLTGELVVEACERVLFRPEKKLVRELLSWLGKAIDRHPDAAADLVAALGIAFAHESVDVQARAVKLLLVHSDHLTGAARPDLESRTRQLPSDQRERLAGLLAVEPDPATVPLPDLAAPQARPMPEPIAAVAELAERIAGLQVLLATDPHGENLDATSVETILAALVAFSHSDRERLATALEPVLADRRFIDPRWYARFDTRLLDGFLYTAARAAGSAPPLEIDADILYGREVPDERRTREWLTWSSQWRKGMARMPGPERVLAHRLVETAIAVVGDPVPELVATPTDVIGRLDVSVLIERLRRAESENRRPWEFDLQQALLRLPEQATDAEIARAEELSGPAGRRLADWLADRCRPQVTVTDRPMVMYDRNGDDEVALPLAKVAVRQPDPIRDGGGVQLLDQLRLSFPQRVREEDVTVQRPDWPRAWSAVLPSRRDVLAAHLARTLGPEAYWDTIQPRHDRYYLSMLPDLAEADGPAVPGFTACLAFALNVSQTGDRAGVVDTFTMLAAGDQLDHEAVAIVTADLIVAGLGKCTRIATALREIAEAGAAQQVWRILAAMLPRLLAAEPGPNRLSDLVELATRTAETVAAQGEILAVRRTAGRAGSSKLVKEAKRLHKYLTRP